MLPLKQILFQGRPVSGEAELLYTWLRTRRSLAEAELPAAVHFDTPRSKGGPPGALDLIDFLNKQEGARDAELGDVQERCACLMLCNAGQVKQFMNAVVCPDCAGYVVQFDQGSCLGVIVPVHAGRPAAADRGALVPICNKA